VETTQVAFARPEESGQVVEWIRGSREMILIRTSELSHLAVFCSYSDEGVERTFHAQRKIGSGAAARSEVSVSAQPCGIYQSAELDGVTRTFVSCIFSAAIRADSMAKTMDIEMPFKCCG